MKIVHLGRIIRRKNVQDATELPYISLFEKLLDKI